jgi:glycosyltransferase involved in cell wall biosynthesis
MKLVVFSHKPCWRSPASPSGYATDGGFAFQMAALAGLFDELRLLVPVASSGPGRGEIPLQGERMVVVPLRAIAGRGWRRKLAVPFWALRSFPRMLAELSRCDAVHAPIPGDVGTIGMLMGWAIRRPLLVRHCGNWLRPVTAAERFWRWFMETTAGGRNVMLATGGTQGPPSSRNQQVRWIFSTSLTEEEIRSHGRQRAAPRGGKLRLVHTARQEIAKGAGTIIRALPRLAAPFPGVHLDIIGDGPALGEFRGLAESLGVSSRVSFKGKLTHNGVLASLHQADLFCFPTTSSDGFPKAVLEALATGLPVVATPVSVLPQLLGSGAGVLTADAGIGALAAAVLECVSDPAAYQAMSRKALEVASAYSLESWAREVHRLCQESWRRSLRSGPAGSPANVRLSPSEFANRP